VKNQSSGIKRTPNDVGQENSHTIKPPNNTTAAIKQKTESKNSFTDSPSVGGNYSDDMTLDDAHQHADGGLINLAAFGNAFHETVWSHPRVLERSGAENPPTPLPYFA
jgi:hypothetical protein